MTETCHLCGQTITVDGAGETETEGFVCADCGEKTCHDCKSIAVAKKTDHCVRCRG